MNNKHKWALWMMLTGLWCQNADNEYVAFGALVYFVSGGVLWLCTSRKEADND